MFNVYHEFVFDERSYRWRKGEPEHNLFMVRSHMHYLSDTMRIRGYIYLNQIYESLGVEWYPNDGNICYTMNNSLGYIFCYEELPNNEGYKICVGREVG